MIERDLSSVFSESVLESIERLIDERVAAAMALAKSECFNPPEWLTVSAAAGELDCSVDAVRMRAKRGRLVTRRQGRRVYVLAASVRGTYDPADSANGPAALATPGARHGR